MTILIISMIRDPWGGSEEILLPFSKELIKNHHTVIHSTFRFDKLHSKVQALIEMGVVHIPRRGYVKSETFRPLRIAKKAANRILNLFSNPFKMAFSLNPDYVLYNGTAFSIAQEKYLLPYLLEKKIPFGILGHHCKEDGSDLTESKLNLYTEICQKAKHLFFVSSRTQEVVEKRTHNKLDNAIIIRNPVNLKTMDALDFYSNPILQFAMVGYIRNIHKGHDILIDVLSNKDWKNRNWQLNIYGKGSDRRELEKKIHEAGIASKVIFWGATNDIREIWSKNQLLLMPSRMEGMPLAVVEAMICGRPVVATDVGGHKEWIRDGIDGWVAEQANTDSFALAMERAWTDQQNWKEIGGNARERAISLYDENPGLTLLNHIVKN